MMSNESQSTNHWGVTVRHDTPTTGVLQNNQIEYLGDEMSNGIDLGWIDAVEQLESEIEHLHNREPTDEEIQELADSGMETGTILIGDWKQDSKTGLYEADPDKTDGAGYSAIVGEIYTQVVWSETTTHAALCSPCFPGQADVRPEGNTGDYLAYTLPTDLIGYNP